MTDNCSDDKAQFGYLNKMEQLQNIETQAVLISRRDIFGSRWGVFKVTSPDQIRYQGSHQHHLKQTANGSLHFYKLNICAEPSKSENYTYLMRKTYCNKSGQKFTFGNKSIFT